MQLQNLHANHTSIVEIKNWVSGNMIDFHLCEGKLLGVVQELTTINWFHQCMSLDERQCTSHRDWTAHALNEQTSTVN